MADFFRLAREADKLGIEGDRFRAVDRLRAGLVPR